MANPSNPAAGHAHQPRLVLERPDIDRGTGHEPGIRLDLLRWLAAVAGADGAITLAEYQALCSVAQQGASAHEMLTALKAIEQPKSGDSALASLRRGAKGLPEEARRSALEVAMPLLRLQGEAMPALVGSLASALAVMLTAAQQAACKVEPVPGLLQSTWLHPIRALKSLPLKTAVVETVRLTGDGTVNGRLGAYLEGSMPLVDIRSHMQAALAGLVDHQAQFEQQMSSAVAVDADAARRELELAEQLFKQVEQRLAIVEARIRADKEHFEEDFDEVLHDAGNAVELEMLDRLKTYDWTLKRVWESMGRTTFAKELERRVDRIAKRHERQLGLLKEDLRLFQDEYRLVHARIAQRTHHAKLQSLMPDLRIGTRVLNAVDSASEVTLGGGVIAGLGTGAAIYAFGSAVVLPVIAPIAPFAGAALLVAGALKWMMDSSARKGDEVRDKRQAFEKALSERLESMRESYFSQLDKCGEEFLTSAQVLVRPVLLEAQATRDLATIEARVARQVLENSRRSVRELHSQLQG